ncbi:MAG: DUF6519 domain-containing protein, partial [Gaiellaceae bacterium]
WAKAQIIEVSAALDVQIAAAQDPAVKKAAQDAKTVATKAIADFVTAIGNIGVAGDEAVNCKAGRALLDALSLAAPRLRAVAKRDARNPDPCAIAADVQYRGRENQLYRLEVHAAGAVGEATVKWSRENGSVMFAVIEDGITADAGVVTVELEDLGRDRRSGLCEGDWVEITGNDFEFGDRPNFRA